MLPQSQKNGENMTLDYNTSIDITVEPVFTLPPIAGFWRRLAAWIVDSLVLGIFGQVLGWSFSSLWFHIGPYGRIVGLLLILPFFGLMNSKAGKGQTLGKRLLNIAVRNRENKPIGVVRSFLRISVLAIPTILNQWTLPVFQIPVLQWLITVIIFGVGSAIIYTMVFNRKARQGLHDLVCKTYVVHLKGAPIEAFPQSASMHWIVSGVLIGLAVVLATGNIFIGSAFISRTSLSQVYGLYQILQTDNRFFTVGVNDKTLYSSKGTSTHILQVQVWYKGVPSNEERARLMNEIATVVLDNTENIDRYDLLRITVSSSFDLGIASGHNSFGDGESIEVWRDRIKESQSP